MPADDKDKDKCVFRYVEEQTFGEKPGDDALVAYPGVRVDAGAIVGEIKKDLVANGRLDCLACGAGIAWELAIDNVCEDCRFNHTKVLVAMIDYMRGDCYCSEDDCSTLVIRNKILVALGEEPLRRCYDFVEYHRTHEKGESDVR